MKHIVVKDIKPETKVFKFIYIQDFFFLLTYMCGTYLLGNIVNTNSAYLSEKCAQLGLSVYYESVVGDNRDRMKAVIASALDRTDVVILSGGLGTTEDDLT